MQRLITKAALGLSFVVATLVAAGSAQAQQFRLRNADTSYGGNFYLGIPPGPQNGHVGDNVGLVVWEYSQNDQLWTATDGYEGLFYNYYTNPSWQAVCIGVEGGLSAGNGARVIDQVCNYDAHPEQYWQMIGSNKVGLEAQYPNCYIMWNGYLGKAMGVMNRNVQNGGEVILWDYDGTANQFWCR